MDKRDTFSGYHPVINFVFYFGAFAGGMFFMHPLWLMVSVCCGATYAICLKGKKAWKFLAGMLPLICLIALINPLVNSSGETVLFTWGFGGHARPYTMEALYYGMAIAAMMLTVFLWFFSYNEIMTSDKFLYLFGGLIPSASLVLTMVLRLVPNYQKRAQQMSGARRGIGLAAEEGTVMEKVRHGMAVLSAMISWALEGGVVMADSMQSRGYGCSKKRTSFSIYRWEKRDKCLLAVMTILLLVMIWCTIHGGAGAAYTPDFEIAGGGYMTAGAAAYLLFLGIPTALYLMEELTWHILKSRI